MISGWSTKEKSKSNVATISLMLSQRTTRKHEDSVQCGRERCSKFPDLVKQTPAKFFLNNMNLKKKKNSKPKASKQPEGKLYKRSLPSSLLIYSTSCLLSNSTAFPSANHPWKTKQKKIRLFHSDETEWPSNTTTKWMPYPSCHYLSSVLRICLF